jgi:RNA polymerase sigma-70 factor (ECF subfamily)
MTAAGKTTQLRSVDVRVAEDLSAKAPLDFRALFREEFAYVWSTLRRMGVRERDLEDVTHDTFVKVSARLADYDSRRPLRPWLFGFAFRVASDYRRLARHRVEVLGEAEAEHPAAAPDEEIALHEARALMAQALEAIDLDRRAVFVLHVLDECPIPEVAAALGIPVNTAYSRLRLAREEFSLAVRRLQMRPLPRAKP